LSSASSPTFRAGAAQAAGYSTGQARGGGKHWTQTSDALRKEIGISQANNPIAWEKATGTDDAGEQFAMVLNLSETPNNLSITVTHKEKIEKEVREIRDYARSFKGNHPAVFTLIQRANELEKTKNKPETITVPKDPIPEIETPESVTLTGISEGATVSFLSPTTSAVTTQPQLPTGAGNYDQETYNIAVEKYGKETADKLATQTYLTKEELKIQYPLHVRKDISPKPTPKTQQSVQPPTPKDEPTSTTLTKSVIFPPTPTAPAITTSTTSYLPLAVVGIVIVVILIILRRRA